jgi:hypothetical protein
MRLCFKCKCVIPNERLDVLPDTRTCRECSTEQAYIGARIYDHKTAGRAVFVRPEDTEAVETLKRFVNRARN